MTDTELERQLTESLTLMREVIGFSRARFYVMDPTGAYRLAASYGFPARFGPEEVLGIGDPLIEWVQFHRKPMYANSMKEAGPLSRVMERESYARMLAAPVSVGSRMVGIVELQDKVAGGLFTQDDARILDRAVGRFATMLQAHDTAGIAPQEPVDPEDADRIFHDSAEPEPPPGSAPPPDLYLASAPPAVADPAPPARPPETRAELSRREILLFRGFVNTLFLSPEIEAVVFSLWGEERAELYVGARRAFSEAGRAALLKELEAAVSAAAPRLKIPREKLFNTEYPFGPEEGEVGEFAGIQTSVVSTGPATLLLTIMFSRAPASELTAALTETHRLVRSTLTDARAASRYRGAYRSLVNFLLEPGKRPYPQLKAHGLAAGFLARRFATHLGMPAEGVEQITVAGLLHDIGLRDLELPYERLAGRRPLDLEEIQIVRKHPAVAAALLEKIEFPYPVAPLVRHHHERWDGSGYPDRLAGEEIPFGSRLISIAEVYDAMTSVDSYRSPILREDAIQIIVKKGGTQFDPELVEQFAQMMREDAAADAPPPAAGYRETRL
jgi:HD domain-containing protein/GAF domain-containing protein